ncbi:hypothetical protein ES332_D13G018700v1, partial [Gossypium tomentosum]
KRNDPSGSKLISNNRSDRTNKNLFYSIYSNAMIQQSFSQNHETIHTLLNRNKESQSLIILSSSNCFCISSFNDVKYHNVIKQSIKKDPLIPIKNLLGPLGTTPKIANFFSSFYPLITHNQTSVAKCLELDNLKQAFQVLNYYLIAKNERIYNFDPCRNIILNAFICENVCIAKSGPLLKSCQVFIVQVDSIVIRSAKPYLATTRETVHGHYGEILYEGNTLVTFIYEKSRSDVIRQGLLKVEQVLEARSINSILMNLKK